MPDQYNFIAELGFGGFAFLILFLMLYTKPRKTKIYFINFLGITVSIITTALHLFLIYMSSSPKTYAMPFFDTICILFLIFYIILVSLIFNYIMLLSPSLGISLKKKLTIEAVYSSIYIIIMYILLCKDMLYKTTSSGIEFTTFFYSYIIIGILSASYCLWTTIHNQKHLAKTIVMCVYIFVPVDIILLVLQLFMPHTIFISITYVLPLTIFYTMFHSNPFNEVTGCQNEHSFETRFIDNMRIHRKFTIIYIKLASTIADGHYHDKKQTEFIAAAKCQKIEAIKHGIHIYSLPGNAYAVFTNSRNMVSLAGRIKTILEEPIEYNGIILEIHYKMAAFNNNTYITDITKLFSFITYLNGKFSQDIENQCIICEENDYADFFYLYKIECMLADIRNKMDLNDERVICYTQPIYSIEQGTFRTAEALIRLNMDGETIYPDKFINIAEHNGCIHALTCIMLNKVCHTIKKLEGKYDFDAITVNCSTIEMSDNNLHNELLGIIKDNHIECSKVRFELTESAMINDHDAVTSNMEILHNAGIRFYLDDFGTGYSNLERIITLPFMTIKFDKSILYKALNDEDMNEIVSSMVNIFKKKGLVLLVEGVENDEHNEYSIQHGFDYIQGYKYARPVPIAELEEYFEVSF